MNPTSGHEVIAMARTNHRPDRVPKKSERARDLLEGFDLGPEAYDETGIWIRPANRKGKPRQRRGPVERERKTA